MRHRVNAARVAVQQQIGFFRKQFGDVSSEWKADETRVTFADFAISENLFAELHRSFPDDQFFSEESGPLDEKVEIEARYTWILDPIDGTNNYALGLSNCAISLALLKKGQPVYGFVYDGSVDELLEGGLGYGILINGKKHLMDRVEADPSNRIIALHFPLPAGRAKSLSNLLESSRIRSLGSATLHLAYTALGRLDGVIDEKVRLWDVAAAVALLEAAGLSITYFSSNPFPVQLLEREGEVIRYAAGPAAFVEAAEKWLG